MLRPQPKRSGLQFGGRRNDQTLRDIGITRVEAAREAQKPFWR